MVNDPRNLYLEFGENQMSNPIVIHHVTLADFLADRFGGQIIYIERYQTTNATSDYDTTQTFMVTMAWHDENVIHSHIPYLVRIRHHAFERTDKPVQEAWDKAQSVISEISSYLFDNYGTRSSRGIVELHTTPIPGKRWEK
jgi:hypothetical protein